MQKMPNHTYRMDLERDNTYTMHIEQYPSVLQPWLHVKKCEDRLCQYWYDVLFEDYRLLPAGCTGCWKVVTKMQTLKQLMDLYKLQLKHPFHACKCGLDQRSWTDCLYSAYWYCPLAGGLEEARNIWKQVNKLVHKHVDPKLEVYLKRG